MPPTKLGLTPGSTIEVEDAILGLVTRSANDAAAVLGEALGGSESRFGLIMTRKARDLGMTRTVFRNASGLPDAEQRTTARDLSRLATHLITDFPGYYKYFSRRSFTYLGRVHGNHNRLLARYPGMDGLKTGYTRESGFNLAASAVHDGRRLVAVVVGGATSYARDARMVALLDTRLHLDPTRATRTRRCWLPAAHRRRCPRRVAGLPRRTARSWSRAWIPTTMSSMWRFR